MSKFTYSDFKKIHGFRLSGKFQN